MLFNGKGICSTCHGVDGDRNRLPRHLTPNVRENIAELKSMNDEDRFRSIKFGHPGIAMFPKHLLRDDDIRDVVTYLGTPGPNKP